jgi:hypothetical protein
VSVVAAADVGTVDLGRVFLSDELQELLQGEAVKIDGAA